MITSVDTESGHVVDGVDGMIASVMERARIAQRSWSRSSIASRRKLLRRLRHHIAASAMDLADASASQRGRPTAESLTAEVLPLLEACRFLERELQHVLAPRAVGPRHRPLWLHGTSSQIVREPYGVILIIGPGNYPLLLPGVQMLQAIAAGNAVLLKPGSGGTPAAERLIELIHEVGFDPSICRLLPETVDAAKGAIDHKPDKVIFTGSSATGRLILHQLADHSIPCTVELSGCDAVIIREDADLDLAAAAIAFGLTLNDGATCMAPRRAFVNTLASKEFELKLQEKLRDRLKHESHRPRVVESPQAVNLPLSLRSSVVKAISCGARIIHGSLEPHHGDTMPLVVVNVDSDADLLQESHFSSLLSIVNVENDRQAVTMTNQHNLGLGASVFTSNAIAARTIARELAVGAVCINDLIIPTADPRLPLGGTKQSGFGTTQGAEGLLEMTVPKVISHNHKKVRYAFAPLRRTDGELFTAFIRVTHSFGLRARASALISLIDQLKKYKRSSNRS